MVRTPVSPSWSSVYPVVPETTTEPTARPEEPSRTAGVSLVDAPRSPRAQRRSSRTVPVGKPVLSTSVLASLSERVATSSMTTRIAARFKAWVRACSDTSLRVPVLNRVLSASRDALMAVVRWARRVAWRLKPR